jgi:C4-dicarboxylate-specific signal transduction histidine kinase
MHLAAGVPVIETDRVQTQQAILNLIMNSVEAMRAIGDGTRRAALLISTRKAEQCGALLEVGDSDPGLALAPIEHLFGALDTTKEPHGAVFHFMLPPTRALNRPVWIARREATAAS